MRTINQMVEDVVVDTTSEVTKADNGHSRDQENKNVYAGSYEDTREVAKNTRICHPR